MLRPDQLCALCRVAAMTATAATSTGVSRGELTAPARAAQARGRPHPRTHDRFGVPPRTRGTGSVTPPHP
eukprot:5133804-Prymnesium_polylepis.1